MADYVKQDRAVAVLCVILTEDLPQCSWIVFPDTGLEGWIVEQDDPGFDGLEALHVWASKFDANVSKSGKVLVTAGTYGHVPIRILAKDSPR